MYASACLRSAPSRRVRFPVSPLRGHGVPRLRPRFRRPATTARRAPVFPERSLRVRGRPGGVLHGSQPGRCAFARRELRLLVNGSGVLRAAYRSASSDTPSPKDLSELSGPLAVAFEPEAPRPAAVAAACAPKDCGALKDSNYRVCSTLANPTHTLVQGPAPESEVRVPCPVPRPHDSRAVPPGGPRSDRGLVRGRGGRRAAELARAQGTCSFSLQAL